VIAATYVLAWLIFRRERAASRRHDVTAVRAVLLAVQRAIVLGIPELGDEYQGWGRLYFARAWNGSTALQAGDTARKLVERGGSYQAYRIPVASLERLATPAWAEGLLSEETVFAANFALWRVNVFNQMVEKQTSFNVAHAVEIADGKTSAGRRQAISLAAREINIALHLDGIGLASGDGGWYRRLMEAVAADVRRLDRMRESAWWRNYSGAWHLLIGDLAAVLACVALLALGGVRSYDAVHDDDPQVRPGGTPAPAASTASSTTSSTASTEPPPSRAATYRTTTIGGRTLRGRWP
jgi:hypothetical protein